MSHLFPPSPSGRQIKMQKAHFLVVAKDGLDKESRSVEWNMTKLIWAPERGGRISGR